MGAVWLPPFLHGGTERGFSIFCQAFSWGIPFIPIDIIVHSVKVVKQYGMLIAAHTNR